MPVVQKDEIDRIKDKLRNAWVNQLLHVEEPTLLVALTENVFHYNLLDLAHDIYDLRIMLSETLPGRKMLSAILFHEESFFPPTNSIAFVGDGARFVRDASDGHDRALLLFQTPMQGRRSLPKNLNL